MCVSTSRVLLLSDVLSSPFWPAFHFGIYFRFRMDSVNLAAPRVSVIEVWSTEASVRRFYRQGADEVIARARAEGLVRFNCVCL